jgi:hypothetical protein
VVITISVLLFISISPSLAPEFQPEPIPHAILAALDCMNCGLWIRVLAILGIRMLHQRLSALIYGSFAL